jgi:hypothetical protein
MAFPLYDALQKELKNNYYMNVPFPLERSTLESAMQAFFKLLDVSPEIKETIKYSIAPQHRRGDIGFTHREPGKDSYNDSKDFFHFHPTIFEKYGAFLQAHPIVYDFAFKANQIWNLVYETTHAILRSFDEKFPGTSYNVFKGEPVHIVLRFLKYNWQNSGRLLAKPHFDAGACTLAIGESCPGLRIGSCPDDLKLVDHIPGKAIFMWASNYRQVIDTDAFLPGWHDVIQLDETFIGRPFARWAVVAFIDAFGVEGLPKTETHKWRVDLSSAHA